ncbi:MAG: DIP1984 family protein [Gammaproteobacteria bacterium]|nr:DIP1984 family protein [Gammaproteobacteria bacterium]
MKLAEALVQRADRRRRLDQLKERLGLNAQVQEDESPSEDPNALLGEYDRIAEELGRLIGRINRTNTETRFDGNRTLTDALAERDILHLRHGAYRHLAKEATVRMERYGRSEIPYRSAVDVTAVQKEADRIATRYRELDAAIQRLNWEADLRE